MRLPSPEQPITLPSDDQLATIVADPSEPPVRLWEQAALLEPLPGWARRGDAALRDAMLQAWSTMANAAWAALTNVFGAQESPRFAEGNDLDALWGDVQLRPRVSGESDAEYRERLLEPWDAVSPNALRTAANRVLRRYFPTLEALFLEPALDFAWVGDVNDGDLCYVQPVDQAPIWGDDTERANAGAYVISSVLAWEFWIVLPAPVSSDEEGYFVSDTETADAVTFVGDASIPQSFGFISETRTPLFDVLISEIEQRRGGGSIFRLFVDGRLLL